MPHFIELYNHSTNSVDVSGCILTDDPATNKFVIPPGHGDRPAGFVSFTQPTWFPLNGAGETVYFIKPDGSRILDAVQFEAQADGVSLAAGRTARMILCLHRQHAGHEQQRHFIGDIVINELMYDPISGNDDDQYIELYNQGTNAVNLSGWQFTSGVTFTFPTNTTLPPDGYLVVARNLTNLFAIYQSERRQHGREITGGKLSHNGERVALAMPQTLNGTNTIYVVEDEVTYGTGGRWGQWSSGGGSSLELIDPRANHRLAANWADSDETQKSSWVNIETTGVLDNGTNYDADIGYAQIGLLDAGECLVDNVEVDFNGTNLCRIPTLRAGWPTGRCRAAWFAPAWKTTATQSSHSLHVRCSDRIWTGANSCQVALNANSLAAGQTATLRFKARWLRGWPEALLRLNGNWLEATGACPFPPISARPACATAATRPTPARRFTK